jgi:hypothetical protein
MLTRTHDVYLVSLGRGAEAASVPLRSAGSLAALKTRCEASGDLALASLCGLVERHGGAVQGMLAAVRRAMTDAPGAAAVLFSTCHKAKGSEFDAVHVSGDLAEAVLSEMPSYDDGQLPRALHEEVNLLYVALTRGRRSVAAPEALLGALDAYARVQRHGGGAEEEEGAGVGAGAPLPPRCMLCGVQPPAGAAVLLLPRGVGALCGACCVTGAAPRHGHGAHLATLVAALAAAPAAPEAPAAPDDADAA